jgi:ketosteroid isomerase-like protein
MPDGMDFKAEVERLFALFDGGRVEELKEMFAADAQGVDEISRKWMRGRAAMDSYFTQLAAMGVADTRSVLSDLAVTRWGDTALVTAVVDQSYSIGGKPVTIKAPGSFLFRRADGKWAVELVHVVPLPEAG